MGLLNLGINEWSMIGSGLGLLGGSKNDKTYERNLGQMDRGFKGLLTQREKDEAEQKKTTAQEAVKKLMQEYQVGGKSQQWLASKLAEIPGYESTAFEAMLREPAATKARQTAKAADGYLHYLDGDKERVFPSEEKIIEPATQTDLYKNEDDLSKRFDTASKDFAGQSQAYSRLISSAQNKDSPASQMAVIFNYLKVLDPASTVREGEFATVSGLGGLKAQLQALYKKVEGGDLLLPEQIDDIVRAANGMYTEAQDQQGGNYNRFRQTAENRGLNPGNVVSTASNYSGFIPVKGLLSGGIKKPTIKYMNGGNPDLIPPRVRR